MSAKRAMASHKANPNKTYPKNEPAKLGFLAYANKKFPKITQYLLQLLQHQ